MSYLVGVDLGTTSTVAAVCRSGGTPQVVPLEGHSGAVPSVVHLGPDGTLLVGEAAQRRALSDPGRVVRDLTRRIGDPTPLMIGRQPVSPDELAARFLVRIVDDVARRESGVAARVAVTHPAGWGPHRMGALHAALAAQGLGSAMLVPEPVAAAAGYAATARVEPGATVGIYDLGGGRCDAAVVRRDRDGFTILGAPQGVEQFGGTDLDEVVLAHIREALGAVWEDLDPTDPDVLAAVADLRREATAAKEALSQDTEVLIPVVLPGVRTQVRLGREEFEEMIRPALTETVEAVRRALDGAGASPTDLAALVLVGGSVRIPLVPQLLSEEFGRDVTVVPDPVGVVATGAAVLAAGGPGAPAQAVGAGRGSARAVDGAGAPRPPAVPGPAGPRIPAAALGPGRPVAPADGAPARPTAPAASATGSPYPRPTAAAEGVAACSGPGTLPLAVGSDTAPPAGTEVLAVARPPKQARPFQVTPPPTSRSRRIAVVVAAGVLALAVLGGVVAFGIGRIGASSEAGAVTPTAVDTSVPAPSLAVPVETPARKAPPPPPPPTRRGTRATATTNATPPTTTAASTAPKVTEKPTTTAPPVTADPAEEGGANGDAGAGAGTGGSGSGTGGADNNAAGDGTGAGTGATEANVAAAAEPDAPAGEGSQNG